MIFQGHWMISSLKQKKSYHLLHILLNDNIHAKTAGEMAKLSLEHHKLLQRDLGNYIIEISI